MRSNCCSSTQDTGGALSTAKKGEAALFERAAEASCAINLLSVRSLSQKQHSGVANAGRRSANAAARLIMRRMNLEADILAEQCGPADLF